MTYSNTKLKAALIGCGRMGSALFSATSVDALPKGWLPLAHSEAIASLPTLDFVAVCDEDGARADRVANHINISGRYTNYKQMLSECKPDLVAIATRMPGRCDIIRNCVDAGVKAIHAEKPLASNIPETRKTLDVIGQNNVAFTYGAARRYMAIYREARKLMCEGAIGALQHITLEHGRDMLMWGHPHSVDLMLFFADDPVIEQVQAFSEIPAKHLKDNLLDMDPLILSATVKFRNQVTATITSGLGFNLRLSGTTGSIVILGDGRTLELHQNGGETQPYEVNRHEIHVDPLYSGTQEALRNLVECVTGQGKPMISLSEIEQAQKTLMAFAFSAIEGGRIVSLSETPNDLVVTSRWKNMTA